MKILEINIVNSNNKHPKTIDELERDILIESIDQVILKLKESLSNLINDEKYLESSHITQELLFKSIILKIIITNKKTLEINATNSKNATIDFLLKYDSKINLPATNRNIELIQCSCYALYYIIIFIILLAAGFDDYMGIYSLYKSPPSNANNIAISTKETTELPKPINILLLFLTVLISILSIITPCILACINICYTSHQKTLASMNSGYSEVLEKANALINKLIEKLAITHDKINQIMHAVDICSSNIKYTENSIFSESTKNFRINIFLATAYFLHENKLKSLNEKEEATSDNTTLFKRFIERANTKLVIQSQNLQADNCFKQCKDLIKLNFFTSFNTNDDTNDAINKFIEQTQDNSLFVISGTEKNLRSLTELIIRIKNKINFDKNTRFYKQFSFYKQIKKIFPENELEPLGIDEQTELDNIFKLETNSIKDKLIVLYFCNPKIINKINYFLMTCDEELVSSQSSYKNEEIPILNNNDIENGYATFQMGKK